MNHEKRCLGVIKFLQWIQVIELLFFFPVSVSEDKEDALLGNASDSNDWLTLLPQLNKNFLYQFYFHNSHKNSF